MIKPETIEQLKQTLQHDFRTVRKRVLEEDPERITQLALQRLGRTVEEASKTLTELSKQINELNKKK